MSQTKSFSADRYVNLHQLNLSVEKFTFCFVVVIGYLSLDCGAPGPYVDEKGITWIPDDSYMSRGNTASVNLTMSHSSFYSDLEEVRYFPHDVTRTRYCYSLPTTIGQTYPIRASHFHGGYDKNPVVKFDTALDVYSTKVTIPFDTRIDYAIFEKFFGRINDSFVFYDYLAELDVRKLYFLVLKEALTVLILEFVFIVCVRLYLAPAERLTFSSLVWWCLSTSIYTQTL